MLDEKILTRRANDGFDDDDDDEDDNDSHNDDDGDGSLRGEVITRRE